MKTLFIFSIGIMMLHQANSQDLAMLTNSESSTFKTTVTDSKSKNASYLKTVAPLELNPKISQLQRKAATYNIKSTTVYDNSEPAIYEVVFKKGKHKLVVNYNDSGQIISSKESYYNVALPVSFRIKVAQQYPQWKFETTKCKIDYNLKTGSTKTYVVTLKKGHESITIDDLAL